MIELTASMLTPGQRRVLDRAVAKMLGLPVPGITPLDTFPAAPLPDSSADHPGERPLTSHQLPGVVPHTDMITPTAAARIGNSEKIQEAA